MKLSQATREQKLKAAAELDGFENIDRYLKYPAIIPLQWSELKGTQDGLGQSDDILGRVLKSIPSYDTSYDAIIPLIQKGWLHQIESFDGRTFSNFIIEQGWIKDCCEPHMILGALKLTPSQLLDALLIATGKFEL